MLDAPRHDPFDDALPFNTGEHISPMDRQVVEFQKSLDLDDHALDGPVETLGFIHVRADGCLEGFIIHGA